MSLASSAGWEVLPPLRPSSRRRPRSGNSNYYNRPFDVEGHFGQGWPKCEAILDLNKTPEAEFRYGKPISNDTYWMCAHEREPDSKFCEVHAGRK